MNDYVSDFRSKGYAVVRKVFAPEEVAELAEAFDRQYAEGMTHPRTFRNRNQLWQIANDGNLGPIVRLAKWPAYTDPTFAKFRVDRRIHAILAPLLGSDLKQITNQLHWKRPGARDVNFAYHQDWMFRTPRECYRNLATSWIQTGIAVDPHRRSNGCMRVLPNDGTIGEVSLGKGLPRDAKVFGDDVLRAAGLEPNKLVDLELEAGDLALWGAYTVHGSGPNVTDMDRRFFINGYVRASDCDRGEWAFRDGVPCPLGEPVLTQFEDLYERPDPHYVDDDRRFAHD